MIDASAYRNSWPTPSNGSKRRRRRGLPGPHVAHDRGGRPQQQPDTNWHFVRVLRTNTRYRYSPPSRSPTSRSNSRSWVPVLQALDEGAYSCQSIGVANVFTSCPAEPEEAADAYLLDQMSPGEVAEFILHLARCSRCSQIVETTRAFIQALRDAAHDSAKTRAATSN